MRLRSRDELEALASGIRGASGDANPREVGQARAELQLQDWEHAEEQEKSRQDFETALAEKQLIAAT